MRILTSKKKTVWISGAIGILGIIVFTFLQLRFYNGFYQCISEVFNNNKDLMVSVKEYFIIISSGLFTGAFLTFLISLRDYFIERRETLERIYLASEDLQRSFSKLEYIFPDESKELITNLFSEIDSNKINEKFNEQIFGCSSYRVDTELYKQERPISYEVKEQFVNDIYERYVPKDRQMENNEKNKIKNCVDDLCDEKITKYEKQIEKVIKSYLYFNSVRTRELTAAFGRLDFILPFANKRIRNHIYNNLYIKQIKTINTIKERNYHFNLYLEGKGGNRGVMLNFIWYLQDMLVSEDEKFYYRQYQYDIDTQMFEILILAYGNKNKNKFPDKKEYKVATKPEAIKHIIEEYGQ